MREVDRRVGWGLIVLAVAVRAAAVLVLQSHRVPHSTYEHGEIAANLLAGRGFAVRFLGADGPTAQQAPVYPAVVAAAYAVGGVGTPRALLVLELGQALLGGLLVAAVLRLAREVAPGRPRCAAAAGLIAALHPTLVYAATHVQVALLAATLLTATLAAAYRAGRTGRDVDAIFAGLGLGSLALTDPISALSAPGMAWAVVLGRGMIRIPGDPCTRGRHRVPRVRRRTRASTTVAHGFADEPVAPGAARPIALVAIMAAAVVAPWVARNARVFGEFVAIKSTFGYAFWQGNCALSRGTDKVVRPSVDRALETARPGLVGWNAALWAARHRAGYLDDVALSADDYRVLGGVSEPERSRILFRRALADLRSDPARYARLCLRRLRWFVLFDETNPKARSLVYRAGHLALTALAVVGLVVMGREGRRRLAPTILTAALIAAFHSLTIVSARFHVPIEPLLGLWGAYGLATSSFGRGVAGVACRNPGHPESGK